MELKDRDSPPGVLSVPGEPEDEVTREDSVTDESPATPPDLEWLEELYESDQGGDDSDGDPGLTADTSSKRIYAETAWMLKLRRSLDQLDGIHQQKEHDVLKARQELKLCLQNTEDLLEQRENLEKEIERQKAAENSVALLRLRAQHKCLCQELHSEEELEALIRTDLRQQELEFCKIEVELGRFSSLRQEVQEQEHTFQLLKAQKAATRLQQERKVNQNLQLTMQHLQNKQTATLRKDEAESQKKIKDNRMNHNIAAKFLKETIQRVQQQEAKKEQQNKELLEKRMQAVKSLKANIAATHESLQIQQNKAKANSQRKAQHQRHLKESLQAQGANTIKHLHQQKQLEEIKCEQLEFEGKQKSKRVEIVAKILQEKELLKKRNRKQALSSKATTTDQFPPLGKMREKLLYPQPRPPSTSPPPSLDRGIVLRDFSESSSDQWATSDLVEDQDEVLSEGAEGQSLVDSLEEPEFCGLWDQNYKQKPVLIQTDVDKDGPAVTSGKLNISATKGYRKELKGPPFISKPEIILFKDFEVGKTYKKKIILTNISYVTNYCKLLTVSAQLKDFISISFEPPGCLSPGMSCDLQAVFQPMINEDLEGEVKFSSTIGPFSVPVKCTIKKCDLEVDSQFIDFGSHVVGQTISRTITLTNKGALASIFSLDTSERLPPETHHIQMSPQATNKCQVRPSNMCFQMTEAVALSTVTDQEENDQIKPCDNQESSASFLESEEAQPTQENEDHGEAVQQEETVSIVLTEGDEAVPDVHMTPDVDMHIENTLDSTSEIHLGNMRGGEIGPFQSIKLEVIFTPTIPAEARLLFYIRFSDINSEPIPIEVRGAAVSVPVWVVEPTIDLKICMFDHLYQDTVIVQSRANTALKLTFEVCQEMKNHIEILPKIGFVQAKSSFNAQLKFLPRLSLPKDAKQFFDRDTGVLEVPLTVNVSGQVQPVHFTVQAIVTSTDLHFNQTKVNFGSCSIYHSVRSRIHLTNRSLLPQDFGFTWIPEFIEVQPNDGFGTLLPQETVAIDLIFSAKKAKKYQFQLICKSGINRDFPLTCRAVGVRPPLELTCSLVQFRATAVGDHSTALLHLIHHPPPDNGPSKQTLPAVDGKSLAPVRPRLFSFTFPKDSGISISPPAGRLLLGERYPVQVTFRPRLSDQDIKHEAWHLLQQAKPLPDKRVTEQEAQDDVPPESSEGRETCGNTETGNVPDEPSEDKSTPEPNPADILPQSEQYEQGRASLLSSFTQRYQEFTIPCFVSDPLEAQPSWSPFNTLYLKLQCPAIQPPLVVISDSGRTILNFHQVAVGEKAIKNCIVQNISKNTLDLSSSVLDIDGPFSLLNALRCIRPGEKHTLLLAFSPALSRKYRETLEVQSQKMTLEISVCGEGVDPDVSCFHPGGVLDFGYVMGKDSACQVLKLHNRSAVEVGFRVLLASQAPPAPRSGPDVLDLLQGTDIQPTVGAQNYSGLSVFSVVPAEGSIAPGQIEDISVTFHPDHSSELYSDRLTIKLRNGRTVCEMDLKGTASLHNMYVCGGDPPMLPIESLVPPLVTDHQSTGASERFIPVMLTLKARYHAGVVQPAVRGLQVGCICCAQSSKKNAEFHWDNVALLQQQGFSVEPVRGSIEPGHTHNISITWRPQRGYKPYDVVQTCVSLTLKGDHIRVYRVTLSALVTNASD